MRSPAEVLQYLEFFAEQQAKLERDRLDILASTLPAALKDEQDVDLKARIQGITGRKLATLLELAQFPPHHDRHQKRLADFYQDGSYDRSVFIMTKYPDPKSNGATNVQLKKLIATVRAAVQRCAYVPRVATDRAYYPDLWDNVELYLLGCGRGIALVEDRHQPELNPNIAMEWGWMRGMGRNVLYLIEETFDRKRADWGGLIEHAFAWDDPAADVEEAVHGWLGCTLQH